MGYKHQRAIDVLETEYNRLVNFSKTIWDMVTPEMAEENRLAALEIRDAILGLQRL